MWQITENSIARGNINNWRVIESPWRETIKQVDCKSVLRRCTSFTRVFTVSRFFLVVTSDTLSDYWISRMKILCYSSLLINNFIERLCYSLFVAQPIQSCVPWETSALFWLKGKQPGKQPIYFKQKCSRHWELPFFWINLLPLYSSLIEVQSKGSKTSRCRYSKNDHWRQVR